MANTFKNLIMTEIKACINIFWAFYRKLEFGNLQQEILSLREDF